jgi:hypothetical protein
MAERVHDYHDGNRYWQDRFDTRRLADRSAGRFRDHIDASAREFIEGADMFFLATCDHRGVPTCSYKGGDPGFVRVLDASWLAFPNYDGNGKYQSMGNLLKNPHVITKAREELDRVIGPEGSEFKKEHLDQLKYIQAIIHEGLRLTHPAPGFNIEPIPSDSKQPILLGNGKYEIAHNQPLILVLAGVNRDPSVFDAPHEFRPERMLGDDVWEKLPRGVTRGFGNGKRECVGRHYAWQWSVATMAQLLRDVDFAMVDNGYDIEKAGMDGWFNVRPIGFEVTAKPRAKE